MNTLLTWLSEVFVDGAVELSLMFLAVGGLMLFTMLFLTLVFGPMIVYMDYDWHWSVLLVYPIGVGLMKKAGAFD